MDSQSAEPDSRITLMRQLLESASFDDTTRLLFERADLLDGRFFAMLAVVPDSYRRSICEAACRAIGLLEDPEIVGPRELQTIGSVVLLTLPRNVPHWPVNPMPASIASEDIQRLLDFAVAQMTVGETNMSLLLAIVHYAVEGGSRATPVLGSPDSPALLRALADVARGRILTKVPGRWFDALQYLRLGMVALEAQYDCWQNPDKGELEMLLTKVATDMLNVRALLGREEFGRTKAQEG